MSERLHAVSIAAGKGGWHSRRRLAAVMLSTLLASCTTLKPPPDESLLNDDYTVATAYLQKYVQRTMKKSAITGLSVALIDGQRVVWTEGFGHADKKAGRDATAQTRYRTGSVSKLFTAMAVMQLVEAGRLDLDAPLRRSIPDFDLKSRFGSTDDITLRLVLSHHSGLPGAYIDGMWAKEPESFNRVVDHLSRHYAAFAPGTVFSYSNAGYTLAGVAIEHVSGLPFVKYMQQELLDPLGMRDSNFSLDVSDSRVSRSYWKGKSVEEMDLRDLPAGALVSTVGDLSQLIRRLHRSADADETVLGQDALEQMLLPQVYDSPHELTPFNGLGFFQYYGYLNGHYRAVGHSGQTMAHSALLISVPELQLGVVLLANSPDFTGALETMSQEILRVAYPVKTGRVLADPRRLSDAEDVRDASAGGARVLPGDPDEFPGHYASEFGLIRISGDAPAYRVNAAGQSFSLEPTPAEGHRLRFKLFGFIPIADGELGEYRFHARNVDGKRLVVMSNETEQRVVATAITPQSVDALWQTRLGRYAATNELDTEIAQFRVPGVTLKRADQSYSVVIESASAPVEYPLEIINESEAVLQGAGRGLGETLLFEENQTLNHLGLRFRKAAE